MPLPTRDGAFTHYRSIAKSDPPATPHRPTRSPSYPEGMTETPDTWADRFAARREAETTNPPADPGARFNSSPA